MSVFVGTLVQSTKDSPLEIWKDAIIGVLGGKIVFVEDASRLEDIKAEHGITNGNTIILGPNEFLMPGLIDSHTHAPQYPNSGIGLDLPLLQWLQRYTFPTEAAFKDVNFARDIYRRAVRKSLRNGTTTACYFATIHLEASIALCDVIEELGQRAYVGKVCMDQNSPDYYIEDTQQSAIDTEKFLLSVLSRKLMTSQNPLVLPAISPRFALSTSDKLMRHLAEIASKYNLLIQSHLAENRAECENVTRMYPECANYSDIYRQAGLFTEKTIMAHGVYLSDEELTLARQHGVGIAHCPNSNISLRSGLCDVRRLLDTGVKVGLGTDTSGGFHPSVLDAIRYAVQTSKIIGMNSGADYRTIDYKEAFRLATLGGADVLGLAEVTGNFQAGKDFDAIRIDPYVERSPFDVFPNDDMENIVQKFIYMGDDRNIVNIYVKGRDVTV